MTNKRAERRNYLHSELGDIRILKEDCKDKHTDFMIQTKQGDTCWYRVSGMRSYDMSIERKRG